MVVDVALKPLCVHCMYMHNALLSVYYGQHIVCAPLNQTCSNTHIYCTVAIAL